MGIIVYGHTAILNIGVSIPRILFELTKQHGVDIYRSMFREDEQKYINKVAKIILKKSTIIIKNRKLKINIPEKVANEVVDYMLKKTLELKD